MFDTLASNIPKKTQHNNDDEQSMLNIKYSPLKEEEPKLRSTTPATADPYIVINPALKGMKLNFGFSSRTSEASCTKFAHIRMMFL